MVQSYSVGLDANVTGLLVLDEPSPAATLDSSKSSIHLVLELLQAAVGVVDGSRQGTGRGLTTASALGSKVLPEEGVVQVTTTVEVDQGLESDLSGNVVLVLGLLELLNGSVVAVDVGLMVVLVVKLHDLAGDGGLESAIVVYKESVQSLQALYNSRIAGECIQDRSGRVALPRAKVKPAMPAVLGVAEAPARRAVRAEVRTREAAIVSVN